MVHFIFMDHKNFDVYFILFLWPASSAGILAWWAQSVSARSVRWLSILLSFSCISLSWMAKTAFSFSSSAHSISFTHTHKHTHSLAHTFIFDIFTYRFIHLYQLLLLLLLLLSTLLTVPFRSFCSVSALHGSVRFGSLTNECVCCVRCSLVFYPTAF